MSHVRIVDDLSTIPENERNLCLVVEQPIPGYEDAYKRCGSKATSLNASRWKYVSHIHAVMPNVRQLYLFRTLEWKHYHCDRHALEKAVKDAKEEDSDITLDLCIYPPTKDVLESPFAKVINVKFDGLTESLIDSIPLVEIATSVHKDTVLSPPDTTKKKPKRQQFHKDVGFTTGRCVIGKDELGVSVPALKPATDDIHVKAMVAISALMKHHIFVDLKDTVYFDTVHASRADDFAKQLHPDNVLEALRSALSNVLNPCGCHGDAHNDNHPNFKPVITLSYFIEIDSVIYRIALIGYSRLSIRGYYERRSKPDAKLVRKIKEVIGGLSSSRIDWEGSLLMINGGVLPEPHKRMGDTELGFCVDHCHMNCFRYLSAWIHFASKLITHFSLSFEDTVGLIIGMYCENNPITFVLVAKDLLLENDSMVNESMADFGFTVRKRMMKKKSEIRKRFGTKFTFPQRFRHCWTREMMTKMMDPVEFRNQSRKVAAACKQCCESWATLKHRKHRLETFVQYSQILEKEIYGAGELVCKHLIPIMSVIGVLPVWMSTMSYLSLASPNYQFFVEKYKLGATQGDSNAFMRMLAHGINRHVVPSPTPIAPKVARRPSSRSKSPSNRVSSKCIFSKGDRNVGERNVDLFHAENESCKFKRVMKGSDRKYFDTVFILQSMYVPNALNNSLNVFSPGEPSPKTIISGHLHEWETTKDEVSLGSSRKSTSPLPERHSRKQKTKKSSSVPKVGPQSTAIMLWLPRKVHRSRGLFKRPPLEPKAFVNSIARHVEVIQNEGLYTSAFEIQVSNKGGRKYHTLVSVRANGVIYVMNDIDLSVVLYLMESQSPSPTYEKKKECTTFGNLFLLLLVYPARWFPKLIGTPSVMDVMDSGTPTVEVRRNNDTMFYLKRLSSKSWQLTPNKVNYTFEYK
jgi:hypothetical protein